MRKQTIKPAVFDGTNRLETPQPFENAENDEWSAGGFINVDGLGTSQQEFIKDYVAGQGGFIVRYLPSSNGYYVLNRSVGNSPDVITRLNTMPNGARHLFATFKNEGAQSRLSVYVDGVLDDELISTQNLTMSAVATTLIVGENCSFSAHNVIVSNKAYTAEEVKRLYNQGLNISASSLNRLGLNQGLICAYALDEENEGIDLSGNENHLSNINNVTFNGSPVDTLHTGLQTNNTLKADGTQYLTGAKISNLGEDFFFSCFAKFDDLSVATQYIFEEGGKVSLRVLDSGERFYINYASTVESRQIQVYMTIIEGQLYHLAGEVDATTGRLAFYVDGVKIGEDTVSDTNKPNANTGIFAINYGSFRMKGSLHNIYFGRKAFGQQGVDWFRNKGVPRDLSIMPSTYASEALSIYEPTLLNGGKDISGNGNDCAIVGTPAYTAVEEAQKLSSYLFPSVFYGYDSTSSDHLFATTSDTIGLYDGFCSISFTFSIPSTGANHVLIGQNGSGLHWYVRVRADGYLHLYCFPKSGSGSLDYYWATPVTANQEYDAVIYFGGYDGSDLSLFIDGAEHPNKTLVGGTGSVGNISEITHNLQVAYTAWQSADSIAKVYNLRKMTGDATTYASELPSLNDSDLSPTLQTTLQHSWLLGYGQGSSINTEANALVDRVGGVDLQASGTATYTITEKTIK